MPMKYKLDILKSLKDKGYNTTSLRKEHILSEGTIQKFRNGEMVSTDTITTLCNLLHCQPGDILEYVPDEDDINS